MKSFRSYLRETSAHEWDTQEFHNDVTGETHRVKDVYDFAHENGRKENVAITDTDALEWWDKSYSMDNPEHVNRMNSANTSYPVLAVEYSPGKYTIADGLNRIKKAHSIEKKTHVPAVIITQKQLGQMGKK